MWDDIRHIFFDLDRTLWDFERNSAETLTELFNELELTKTGIPDPQTFIGTYIKKNALCWSLYEQNKIGKAELRSIRFQMALLDFGVENQTITERLSVEYIERSPYKTRLFPHTLETLAYLAGKYTLHIITNGFEEVQHIKLERSGLRPYFKHVTTSEIAGHKKPDPRIFQYAMGKGGAHNFNSLMIGDDHRADVLGAQNAGMKGILFRPDPLAEKPHGLTTINDLNELRQWL